MLGLLTKLMKKAPKRSEQGFTLIELLVAMVIATLVITPLLGFMIDILNRDRIEQAKATSEAEIQAAIDYIAQDLEQAVYIYDATGLDNISNLTAGTTSGIKDQIPPVAEADGCGSATPTCVPILVFWKREPRKQIIPNTVTTSCAGTNAPSCDDTFVYSLVSYYLVKGATANKWSNTARIARFQIKNGVINPTTPTTTTGGVTSPNNLVESDPGFNLFDVSLPGTTLQDKMNRWQKASAAYTAKADVLVDFIDQSTIGITPSCPATTQPVPSTLVGGFYACIDSSRTLAQVFIRGNALARIQQSNTYTTSQSTYFPTANIQVKGRSFLSVN
ncbi:MAG: hormogonium polysaccharide secretion pseudopilin HpsC [Chroococcus sp. CMT-3BRIN-NPC107]|nr:hormogonium polysaccharide secretion pseudopilin HpsC [Chroococcus sp. CMT-3BRIN-NPC107]